MFPAPETPVICVEDFCPQADQMRENYERFFNNPHHHGAIHQVWDYWFVPEIYTYLRTNADKVIHYGLVEQFIEQLREFAGKLGLKNVSYPYISVYVNGCHQAVHNDAMNGVYGYVYSITKWDQRNFTGGETLVGKRDVFDHIEPREPRGRNSYFDVYPSRFNQLLLFDDRYPHMVPAIHGQMDPLSARVVLHGHLT